MTYILVCGGYIFWIFLAYEVILFTYLRLFKRKFNWSKYAGEWALISGSSDGSGRSLAFCLAKRGINVILVARSMERMKQIAAEIEQLYHVQTKCISIDFTNGDTPYDAVQKEIQGLTVSILVNNVGGVGDSFSRLRNPIDYYYRIPWSYPDCAVVRPFVEDKADSKHLFGVRFVFHKMVDHCVPISDNYESYDEYMTQLNLVPALRLSKMLLSRMVERRKGAILTVSTLASISGMPFLTCYTYNKAALNMFTADLAMECKKFGITIGLAYAGAMRTSHLQSSPIKEVEEFGSCDPDQFAEKALATFGRELHVVPYWLHDLQRAFLSSIPEFLREMMLYQVGHKMHSLTEKAAKKQ